MNKSICGSACLRTSFGGQDLAADRLGHHPRRSMHRLPVQVAVALGDLAGVDADTDLDGVLGIGCVVLMQRALDGGGGTNRCNGGREGDEEPVAQRLAHPATELPDLVVHDSCLQPQNVVGVRSPRARRSAVERTTSVIMTVSSLAARLLPDNGCLPLH